MKKYSISVWSCVLCLVSLISSCNYSNQYQTLNANNKFSIAVPSWMKEDNSLKPGADFQYANHFRNMYVIGETISKADVKRTNTEIMFDNITTLKKSMPNAVVSDSTEITAGSLKGTRVEIFGKMSNGIRHRFFKRGNIVEHDFAIGSFYICFANGFANNIHVAKVISVLKVGTGF